MKNKILNLFKRKKQFKYLIELNKNQKSLIRNSLDGNVKVYKNGKALETKDLYDLQNHSNWGDSIYYEDQNEEGIWNLNGHLRNLPSKNSFLMSKMESGKTLLLVFIEVKYCQDPHDMFFAKAKPLGYLEGNKLEIEN